MPKSYDDEDDCLSSGSETRNFNFTSLKASNELFNDEDYVAQTLVSVRRIKLPKGEEDWEFKENNKPVLRMKGVRFSKSEKEFFRTVDGMKFLVSAYKSGAKSVVKIKELLKTKKA